MVERATKQLSRCRRDLSMLECRETLATSPILFHLLFYNGDEDRWSNQRCLLVPLRPSSTLEEQTVESERRVELLELRTGPFLSICSNMTRIREIKQNQRKLSGIFPDSQLLSQCHETWRAHWQMFDLTAAQTVQTRALTVSALTLR